jgi:hypothetical protein
MLPATPTSLSIYENNILSIPKFKKIMDEIIKDYKKAFEQLCHDIILSPFLKQFLFEIIMINLIFYPRRKKAIKDYYRYGCTREIFSADNDEMSFKNLKEYQNTDISKAFVDIHRRFCPIE